MINFYIIFRISLLLLILVTASCQQKEEKSLFDGKTLAGWEGANDVFHVENGCIVGGSLEMGLEESYYLCTTEESSRYQHPETFPVAVLKLPERELSNRIVKPYDWNEVQIRALGKEIEIKINGITTIKYTETIDVPTKGSIGLQAHEGEPYEVHFKDIRIRNLD